MNKNRFEHHYQWFVNPSWVRFMVVKKRHLIHHTSHRTSTKSNDKWAKNWGDWKVRTTEDDAVGEVIGYQFRCRRCRLRLHHRTQTYTRRPPRRTFLSRWFWHFPGVRHTLSLFNRKRERRRSTDTHGVGQEMWHAQLRASSAVYLTITSALLSWNSRRESRMMSPWLIQTFLRILPRICANRFSPSKHIASRRPFPNILTTWAYSIHMQCQC